MLSSVARAPSRAFSMAILACEYARSSRRPAKIGCDSVTRYAQSLRGRMVTESSPSPPNDCSMLLRVRSPVRVIFGMTAESRKSLFDWAMAMSCSERSMVLFTSSARRIAPSNVNRFVDCTCAAAG
jgi:hypothetical protein